MSMSETVKAVLFDNYGGAEVLQLRPIPAPKPGPGDLLIDVYRCMNPIDWKVRSGMLQKVFPITFPAITGRDGSGVVVVAGRMLINRWLASVSAFSRRVG